MEVNARLLNLLASGLDSNVAKKAIDRGFSLSKLKSTSKQKLREIFSEDEIKEINSLKRKPIDKEIITQLIERSHGKCCVCWEYTETKPYIIHHINEHSKTQDDSYENLVILCLNHHADAHSSWKISRPILPPEKIRHMKSEWEKAIADFVRGQRPPPSQKLYLTPRQDSDFQLNWRTYLEEISNRFKNWHIPEEISMFIDWEVKPVPIDDYIRLKVRVSSLSIKKIKSNGKKKSQKTISLSDALVNQSILLVGGAGTGKSTSLRYLSYLYATEALSSEHKSLHNVQIPILIQLRRYGNNKILDFIKSQFARYGIVGNKSELDSILRDSRVLLLLDGLDEVQTKWRTELNNEIANMRESYLNARLVVTSRRYPQPGYFEGFIEFEIVKLEQSVALLFAEAYLGHYQRYAFMHFIEQHRLEDIAKTPLLLAFCIILFKKNVGTLNNLADIFLSILELYETSWEDRKIIPSVDEPITWQVLEWSLSTLAFQMQIQDLGNSVTVEQAHQIFSQEAKSLREDILWSSKHTTFDLVSQLLTHNLLEVSDDMLSFWHGTFQDFFAALQLQSFPLSQVLELFDKSLLNSQIIAFFGGLLSDPTLFVDTLVEKTRSTDDISEANSILEILGSMGEKYTKDILRAIVKPRHMQTIYTAYSILEGKSFKGEGIFYEIVETYSTIDNFYMGSISIDDLKGVFPDPDHINFAIFDDLFNKIILALSQENIEEARNYNKQLRKYLFDLTQEETLFDFWLQSWRINGIDDFSDKLRKGKIAIGELIEFCRNTNLHSSLPYLEVITNITEDYNLRMSALLARQCIIRR